MLKLIRALNGAAVVFSLVWLAGHSTHRLFDWEFWFAAGYLALAVINSVVLARLSRDEPDGAGAGDPGRGENA